MANSSLISKINFGAGEKWVHDASALHGISPASGENASTFILQYADPNSTYSHTATLSIPAGIALKSDIQAVMTYKGSVGSTQDVENITSKRKGDVYVASQDFTYTTPDPDVEIEAGDMFVWNGSSWDIIQTNIDPSKYAAKGHTHEVTISGNTGSESLTPAGTISVTVTPGTTTFSGSYTPAGTISVGTFGYTTTSADVTHSLAITGAAHTHSVNLSSDTIEISYDKANANTGNAAPTVSGSITVSALTGGTVSASLSTTSEYAEIVDGKFASHSHSFNGSTTTFSGNFTPTGTVSKPNITVTPTFGTISVYATGATTLTSASVAASGSGTMNSSVLTTAAYDGTNEVLTLTWGKSSITVSVESTDKFLTNVTLTTAGPATYLAGASATLAAAPIFYGAEGAVSVSGKPLGTISATSGAVTGSVSYVKATGVTATFTGTSSNITASFTLSAANHSHSIGTTEATATGNMPTITIGAASATPTLSGTITVSYDKLSSAKAAFAGEAATVSVSGTPVISSATATFHGEAASHSHSFSGSTTSSTESAS